MKQSVKFFILTLLLIGVLVGAYIAYQNLRGDGAEITKATTTQSAQSGENTTAADFKAVDKNGNDVRLSDLKGKPAVVNFWASWCEYCLREMPLFENLYVQKGDTVQVIMLNLTDGERETLKSANKVIDESHYTFPVYYDTYGEALKTYEAYTIPITLFIHSDGTLAEKYIGAMDEATLAQKIEHLH